MPESRVRRHELSRAVRCAALAVRTRDVAFGLGREDLSLCHVIWLYLLSDRERPRPTAARRSHPQAVDSDLASCGSAILAKFAVHCLAEASTPGSFGAPGIFIDDHLACVTSNNKPAPNPAGDSGPTA
jgi:hypothetical protein